MSTHALYVADGHHRYETSLAYQSWRRHQEDSPAVGRPYDYCLAYFASMDDPGTVILPTHRLVTHGRRSDSGHPSGRSLWLSLSGRSLVASLRADFDVSPFADDEALITTLASRPAGEATFGLIVENGGPYLLRPRPSDHQRALLQAEYGAVVAGLPVAVLQAMVLGPCFGISSDPQTQKAQLQFEPDAGVAAAHVRAGRAQAALLTPPTSMAQLAAVADPARWPRPRPPISIQNCLRDWSSTRWKHARRREIHTLTGTVGTKTSSQPAGETCHTPAQGTGLPWIKPWTQGRQNGIGDAQPL